MHRRPSTSLLLVIGTLAATAAGGPVAAAVGVELRAVAPSLEVGQAASFGVYLVADGGADETVSAAEIVFQWTPTRLQLTGLDGTGSVGTLLSQLPFPDPTGVNEAGPPQDGDGRYVVWAFLGQPIVATPAGALVTTLVFDAVGPSPASEVAAVAKSGGVPTVVYSGEVPGLDVTGPLSGDVVQIINPDPGDADGDGTVDIDDLVEVIMVFGPCDACPEDFDGDGFVDVNDLVAVILNWG